MREGVGRERERECEGRESDRGGKLLISERREIRFIKIIDNRWRKRERVRKWLRLVLPGTLVVQSSQHYLWRTCLERRRVTRCISISMG